MIAPRSIGNSTWCAGALSVVALAALGAVLCLGSPEPAEARNGQKGLAQTPAQSCGPLALAKALYLLGHSVDASRCAERVRTAADGSTTMAGLVSAARSLGETAMGMRLSPAELALVNRPAILHVRLPHASEHFLVFAPSAGPLFDLIDPTCGDAMDRLTADQLQLMWKGDCIVFTSRPLLTALKVGARRAGGIMAACIGTAFGIFAAIFVAAKLSRRLAARVDGLPTGARRGAFAALGLLAAVATGMAASNVRTLAGNPPRPVGPRLVLGATVLNLGNVVMGSNLDTSVWMANRGRGMLVIDEGKIRTTCTCVRASVSESRISSGKKAQLRIRLPAQRVGRFRYSVYIPSNDPQGSWKTLVVEGTVIRPKGVVYPPRLYCKLADPVEGTRRSLVYIPRQPEFKVLNVMSDSPSQVCSFQPRPWGDVVQVSFHEPLQPSPFHGTITVVTSDPEQLEIVVPLYGTVLP